MIYHSCFSTNRALSVCVSVCANDHNAEQVLSKTNMESDRFPPKLFDNLFVMRHYYCFYFSILKIMQDNK